MINNTTNKTTEKTTEKTTSKKTAKVAKVVEEQRTYETTCITKVDMPDDKYTALLDRCKTAIEKDGKGKISITDEWGKAKIAYTIGKDNRGRWTYLRYTTTNPGLEELKRSLAINEFVLRHLTVSAKADGSDYEPIRANMPQDLIDRERGRDAWREDRRGGRFERGGERGFDRNDRYERGGNDRPMGRSGGRGEGAGGGDEGGANFDDTGTFEE